MTAVASGARALTKPAGVLLVIVAAWAIVSTWYLNLERALGLSATVNALAVVGAGATMAGILWGARILERLLEAARAAGTRSGLPVWLLTVIAAGFVSRLAWAMIFEVPLRSDHATYFKLAERLYTEGIYQDERGDRAYWPPGYPFFIVAGFVLVGVRPWIPLVGNLILYVATSVATYRIGRLALGERAGSLAVLLLAIWPNYVFSTALASKEMLLTALLPVALLLYLGAIDPAMRGVASDGRLLCSGAVLGMASLAQPSMMLFPGALAGHALVRPDRLLRSARQIAIVTAGMAAVITPWAARNLLVLSAFVPVSTSGGDVFYRANNPQATGGYTPVGEWRLRDLGEVERNRTGYRWGLDWIRTHPGRFLALAVKKQILFFGDDSNGAYETLKRDRANTPLYTAAKGLSNLYWLGVWALILLALRLRPGVYQSPTLLLLALPVIYLLVIDSVFESGARHHVPALGFLAILASGLLAPRPGSGA